ncbi:DUF2244 domain-containing protein [Aurantiacibacter flavus]|uniref:DUF2244 domain-containing protein n=1 Tax=Aurantiacibacter flavus TaxID=3145232 RepID=A0ABV0CTP3_9SPHN
MYSIHRCPQGQSLAFNTAHAKGIVLHLRENRSSLSQDARITFTVLIGLFMAMAILPALKGELLVPIFALGTTALLLCALDWHKRSRPAAEYLTITGTSLSWSSHDAASVELPLHATRLVREEASPTRFRLFLECRAERIEVGRCLSLMEKRAIAPLIASHLGEAGA